MVPIAPLTRPTSTHRLLVSMTRADLARHTTASKPLASSDEALAALVPVCTALMVAIGCPDDWSLATLCSTTASTVGCKEVHWQMGRGQEHWLESVSSGSSSLQQ